MTEIAVQVMSVRKQIQTPGAAAETLKGLREAGYEACESGPFYGMPIADWKGILDDTGLRCMGIHASFEDCTGRRDEIFETLGTLDCKYASIAWLPKSYWTEDGWHEVARILSDLAVAFAGAGFVLSYHNHDFEFMRFGGRSGFQILVEESDPALRLQIDTHWVSRGGGDPVYWLERLAGRIPLLHMKDCVVSPEGKPFFAEVGEGNLNWPAILEAARAGGTEWYVVEQDAYLLHTPLESLAISYRNARAMGLR